MFTGKVLRRYISRRSSSCTNRMFVHRQNLPKASFFSNNLVKHPQNAQTVVSLDQHTRRMLVYDNPTATIFCINLPTRTIIFPPTSNRKQWHSFPTVWKNSNRDSGFKDPGFKNRIWREHGLNAYIDRLFRKGTCSFQRDHSSLFVLKVLIQLNLH